MNGRRRIAFGLKPPIPASRSVPWNATRLASARSHTVTAVVMTSSAVASYLLDGQFDAKLEFSRTSSKNPLHVKMLESRVASASGTACTDSPGDGFEAKRGSEVEKPVPGPHHVGLGEIGKGRKGKRRGVGGGRPVVPTGHTKSLAWRTSQARPKG